MFFSIRNYAKIIPDLFDSPERKEIHLSMMEDCFGFIFIPILAFTRSFIREVFSNLTNVSSNYSI